MPTPNEGMGGLWSPSLLSILWYAWHLTSPGWHHILPSRPSLQKAGVSMVAACGSVKDPPNTPRANAHGITEPPFWSNIADINSDPKGCRDLTLCLRYHSLSSHTSRVDPEEGSSPTEYRYPGQMPPGSPVEPSSQLPSLPSTFPLQLPRKPRTVVSSGRIFDPGLTGTVNREDSSSNNWYAHAPGATDSRHHVNFRAPYVPMINLQ